MIKLIATANKSEVKLNDIGEIYLGKNKYEYLVNTGDYPYNFVNKVDIHIVDTDAELIGYPFVYVDGIGIVKADLDIIKSKTYALVIATTDSKLLLPSISNFAECLHLIDKEVDIEFDYKNKQVNVKVQYDYNVVFRNKPLYTKKEVLSILERYREDNQIKMNCGAMFAVPKWFTENVE